MRYDYQCKGCEEVFEIEKGMNDPSPDRCPLCGHGELARYWGRESVPNIVMPGRPPWTYKECLKYKTATFDGVTVKVDPNKHGSYRSLPGDFVKKKVKGA